MELKNDSSSTEDFILLGISSNPQMQKHLFAVFLVMYLITLVGNGLIILAIHSDSRLHTPMYFFLSNLSFMDICFTTVIVPKMLVNLWTQSKAIPFAGCLAQMYAFHLFGTMDSFLLAVMAIDRFMAIVHPLHYLAIMSPRVCGLLVVGSWLTTNLQSTVHTSLMAQLTFCAASEIPHFFCDLMPLLKLSCSDTSLNELAIFTAGVAIIVLPLICILISYGCIGVAILKVPSTKGICKALSTCGSHLSVVSLYYGTIIGLYFFPSSNTSRDKSTIASVMYTVVTPLLNPFIYSLRNRDMKRALRKLIVRTSSFL